MGCACGGNCACKRAEDAPIPSDPRVSPLDEGLYTPSDTPEMAAEGSGDSSTLIFIDLSGSTGVARADGKTIKDSFMADIKKLIKGAGSEKFTLIGFGSHNGDGRLPHPYGQATRIICVYATPAEVRKCLKDDSLWGAMGGTRFPSSGLIDVLRTQMFSSHSFWNTYPSKTIILTDAYEGDMLRASWDAESFGAESKFDKLAKEIAEEYEEKGKSPKEAMEIGEATAAKIGRAKFGKKKFAKMGKKAESFSAEKKVWDEGTPRRGPYVFPKRKAYPIGNETHAKLALIYSTWPNNKSDAPEVRKKVFTRYPELRKWFEDGKYERRAESFLAEVGPHVPTRIGATTTQRGVVKTYDSIPAGDGHVVGQFTPNMDYAPSGMYGAESITDSIAKGFGSVLGIMSGLIIGGFAMNAVSRLSSDDEN